jgi:hypothetical protein
VLLHNILDLKDEDEVFLAEESLEDLILLPVTSDLLSSRIEADHAIEIIGDYGIVLHYSKPAGFWLLLSDKYSTNKVLKGFRQQHKELDWNVVKTTEEEFIEALIEYFALSLAEELFCDSCKLQEGPLFIADRIRKLESFLGPLIPSNIKLLEIGCGSGMATQSLYNLGCRPFSVEVDRCELCQGLKAGKLEPKNAFVLDARLLNRIFKPESFDAVVGFMVGLIDQVNWDMWKDILLNATNLARSIVLFTVYTQKEAELIARALLDVGWDAKIVDNHDALGIYDQWAVLAVKKC